MDGSCAGSPAFRVHPLEPRRPRGRQTFAATDIVVYGFCAALLQGIAGLFVGWLWSVDVVCEAFDDLHEVRVAARDNLDLPCLVAGHACARDIVGGLVGFAHVPGEGGVVGCVEPDAAPHVSVTDLPFRDVRDESAGCESAVGVERAAKEPLDRGPALDLLMVVPLRLCR